MKIFDEVTEPVITATLQFKLAVALSFFRRAAESNPSIPLWQRGMLLRLIRIIYKYTLDKRPTTPIWLMSVADIPRASVTLQKRLESSKIVPSRSQR
jgi:hypothetical protein